mmetsp:Transcript_28591/g.92229  ORF Transcript_28591/g.92229 Transcript_28591/m.92229 type:complete len:285 (+) Transcript_28591:875-1729(+)
MAPGAQLLVKHIAVLARVHKHHNGRLSSREEVEEASVLLVLRAEDEVLLDCRSRLTGFSYRHKRRPPQVLPRDALNGGRHGSREHERLPVPELLVSFLRSVVLGLEVGAWHGVEDRLHLGLEAHVDHAIGLIKHDIVALVEHYQASLQAVDETSRSSDEDLYSLPDGEALLLDTLDASSAHQREAADVHELAERDGLVVDLVRQLAGGSEDERERPFRRRVLSDGRLLGDVDEHGKHEGGSLTGACLSDADHVPVEEAERDALHLDGRRNLVLLLLDRLEDLRR